MKIELTEEQQLLRENIRRFAEEVVKLAQTGRYDLIILSELEPAWNEYILSHAHCAVFLASDSSRWITGALIPMDGGNLAVNAGGSVGPARPRE